jgi:polysaccharide deacetylase family protein (PEP-CTERM system associated)
VAQTKKKIEHKPVNALTVDVEDYFQVEAFADVVRRDEWGSWQSRVERSTYRLLDLFARRNVRGTFFILGWVAERQPGLVREVAAAGHEIACHSYQHHPIHTQSPQEFRADVRRAKSLLEDITGGDVIGYRAPTYSIMRETLWALDVLVEEGFRYDSSIFPIRHDRYGIPGAERHLHVIRCAAGEITEFPPSTVRLAGMNLPVAGGGYFRLLPYSFFRWGLRQINREDQQPAIFMVHTWEVDPEQPVIGGTRMNVWRHRNNLRRTEARLERLLDDFRFAPVREVLRMGRGIVETAAVRLVGSGPAYAQMAPMDCPMD